MKHSLEVCLVAFTLAQGITPSLTAQTSARADEKSFQSEAGAGSGQKMRKGITVELPMSSNAVAVPEADKEDSLIITVTRDGKVYVGSDPTTPTGLPEKVRSALANHAEKTLYVKADARTAYRNLIQVMDSVRKAGVERLTLLTAPRGGEEPGTLVPPEGLEMVAVSPASVARSSSAAK